MNLIFRLYKIKKAPFERVLFFLVLLAATTVVVATTTTAVISSVSATRAAAAEENEDKDDYPRAVISTEVTHFLDLLLRFHHILCKFLTSVTNT